MRSDSRKPSAQRISVLDGASEIIRGMVVGILRLKLFIGNSHSLKDKRQVLRKLKDKVEHQFNVSVAEVGDNDVWQSASIGFSVVGNDPGFVRSSIEKIERMVESLALAEITARDIDVIGYEEREPFGLREIT